MASLDETECASCEALSCLMGGDEAGLRISELNCLQKVQHATF